MFNFDKIERKIIIWVQVIEWFLSMFFIFGKFLKFYNKGHIDVAKLINFHHKEKL
jgi:hypothetical protein